MVNLSFKNRGKIREINHGDIVWIMKGIKYWHGLAPDNALTHIAIAESLNGSPVEWMEHVSDDQYKNNFSYRYIRREK